MREKATSNSKTCEPTTNVRMFSRKDVLCFEGLANDSPNRWERIAKSN